MKDIEELEKMTLWDITTNEGVFTNFVLGILLIIISLGYTLLFVWCKIKFFIIWLAGKE